MQQYFFKSIFKVFAGLFGIGIVKQINLIMEQRVIGSTMENSSQSSL